MDDRRCLDGKCRLEVTLFWSVTAEGKSPNHGGQGSGDTGLANKIFTHERAGFHTALQNIMSALVAPPTDIDRPLPRPSCLHSLSKSRRCFRLERYWHLPQALWRSDPLIHAKKESISCRPSVDDRPSTRGSTEQPHPHRSPSYGADHSFLSGTKRNSWSFPGGAAKAHWSFCSKSCIRSSGLLHRCFSQNGAVAWRSATTRATKWRSSFRHDGEAPLHHKLGAVRDDHASNGCHYG